MKSLKNNSTNMDIGKLISRLWKHEWRLLWFTLVVDNFGVKYVGKEHACHLQPIIESYYPLSINWTGDRCIRITLDGDYVNKKVHLLMPGYSVLNTHNKVTTNWMGMRYLGKHIH
ncbi:LOW QUALITY PROTEIN: hypothetical protein ACHAW6_004674 [Cyclotella cf. meneghiniana]